MKNSQRGQDMKQGMKVYIYAEVDIDKAYSEITGKSKKIQAFLDTNSLDFQFAQKIRQYKNFRICFDSQIQKFIHKKELNPDLRVIKKNVFTALEDYIIERYSLFLEEEALHFEYESKVTEVEEKFMARIKELTRTLQQK